MLKQSIIGLTALVSAASYAAPWVVVDGSTNTKNANPNQYDVVITGIDGQSMPLGVDRQELEPGLYTFRLSTTKETRQGDDNFLVIEMETKACTRYELAAQHKNRLSTNTRWEPVVVKAVEIASCVKALETQQTASAK